MKPDALTPFLNAARVDIDASLDAVLPSEDGPAAPVFKAMRYAALGPGKRLRPALTLMTGALFDAPRDQLLRAGAAIECIHAYSLAHDDLPAMDDDDARRGRPTTHIAFDEATAILAGDGLLTFAFELAGDAGAFGDSGVAAALCLGLAKASGAQGMVGGQMADLAAERQHLDHEETARMQARKTGALIAFACEAGAIVGRADEKARGLLKEFGETLGLAYQIADDILDIEGEAAVVGKAVGKDADRGKATLASFFGLEGARKEARRLAAEASGRLDVWGSEADLLRQAATYVVDRDK
ncbi:MAG: polyprenyl synthetase family protein [Pseudomonadota bacterium]